MNEKRTDTYYCDRHEEVMQIAQAPGISPRCPVCGVVMTFGRYSESEPVRTLEEACAYLLWTGRPAQLERKQAYSVASWLDYNQPYGGKAQYSAQFCDNRVLIVLVPKQ